MDSLENAFEAITCSSTRPDLVDENMGRKSRLKREKRIKEEAIILEQGREKRGRRIFEILSPLLIFIIVFSVYLLTAPRHAPGYADSDEMIVATHTLGVLHPPGYPLFVLLGKFFTFLPFGSIAFRVSIFTSFFGALTVVLIYLSICKILQNVQNSDSDISENNSLLMILVPAFVGALCLAFSYFFWLYSIIPEKYVLFIFFLALLVFLMLCWHEERQKVRKWKVMGGESKFPYLIAFVFGLTLLSHQVVLFLTPAFLYFVWIIDKNIYFSPIKWIKMAAAFLLSMIPNVYLIFAASRNPLINYGNPNDLEGLYRHLTRYYYGGTGISLGFTIGERVDQLSYYFESLNTQFGLVVLLISLLGLIFILRENRKLGIFLLAICLLSGPLLAMYMVFPWHPHNLDFHRGVHERFYLFASLFVGIFVGVAVNYFLGFLKRYKFSFFIVGLLLSLLIPGILFASHFRAIDRSDYDLAENYIENVFKPLEPNSIFIMAGDTTIFGSYYYTEIKNKRPDVTLVRVKMSERDIEALKKREPSLFSTESKKYPVVIHDIIHSNIDNRPIYISVVPAYDTILPLGLNGTPYYMLPRGVAFKISRTFKLPEENPWQDLDLGQIENLKREDLKDLFQRNILDLYAIGHHISGIVYLDRGYYDLAKKEFQSALKLNPNYPFTQDALSYMEKENLSGMEPLPLPPRLVGYHVRRGNEIREANVSKEESKYYEAMNEYYAALEIDPLNPNSHSKLAELFEEMGWKEEAQEEREKAENIEKKLP